MATIVKPTNRQTRDFAIPALIRELSRPRKPAWLLRKFMNLLEEKRGAKGVGWSRPWNKIGMTIFRSHAHKLEDFGASPVLEQLIQRALIGAPPRLRLFVNFLLSDPALMTFTFYHHRVLDGEALEGFTLSLGRRARASRGGRDRLDIILEDQIAGGAADGRVDQVRVIACPWDDYQRDRSCYIWEAREIAAEDSYMTQKLYNVGVEKYREWRDDPARQWQHWSTRYIDYFGERECVPHCTSFGIARPDQPAA